jgi:hypothetical protein
LSATDRPQSLYDIQNTLLGNWIALHNAHLEGDLHDAIQAAQAVIDLATEYRDLARRILLQVAQYSTELERDETDPGS